MNKRSNKKNRIPIKYRPSKKCLLKKDDKVKIIAGKDKGKIGKILKIFKKKQKITVEKINIVKCHNKPSSQNSQGGIIETEAPLHWSNVMLMCNKCMSAVRVKMQQLENEDKTRICKKCGEIVDA
ncbi:50S ribosomal protein L24 [Desulfococcaceae bacterium HSG7]|nr:50S ribosomal protein L24 [Desulfococcaceae bacterium HSG9]MDM8553783.1 50S ribosomal protein L24 [Desulfococcaceae bacterium HSG7]